MNTISLTTFTDFVLKTGTPRVTCVKQAIEQYTNPYNPAQDFYLPLRRKIVAAYRWGKPPSSVSDVLSEVSLKKHEHYKECIAGLKTWHGRKSIKWIGTQKGQWAANGLPIRINPELGLDVNDDSYAIKLYFKKNALSKREADIMLYLIDTTINGDGNEYIPAVLDVRRGKLFEPTVEKPNVEFLARSEAAAFKDLWDSLQQLAA